MMKEHFKAIAEIVKHAIERSKSNKTVEDDYLNGRYDATRDIALSLSDHFASDNPRFDRAKFLTACGIVSEPSAFDGKPIC